MKRSFDCLARCYEPLERLVFGSRLNDARRFCLPYARGCETALLIGDGDGRFARELLKTNATIRIDSVDRSAGMLHAARARAANHGGERLRTIQADALEFPYPDNHYDFIGLHFALDCFEQGAVDQLAPRLVANAREGCIVAYSDFQTRSGRWRDRAFVWLLYRIFRTVTDIQARDLPRVQWPDTLRLLDRRENVGGLAFAEVWRKVDAP